MCLGLDCLSLSLNIHNTGKVHALLPGPLAQLVMCLTADPGIMSSILTQSHTFMAIDHEIISTVILRLRLIQEGLLSITSESMCMKYCIPLGQACPGKSVVR